MGFNSGFKGLTVMGDEYLQSRLLQRTCTCFVISVMAGCIFQTAFFEFDVHQSVHHHTIQII